MEPEEMVAPTRSRPSFAVRALAFAAGTALPLLAALLMGCASAPAPQATAPASKTASASDYFPLEPGWKWAYDLDRSGEHMLAVYQVLERVPDAAIVQAGDERISYALTRDGVAQKEGSVVGDFVLRNPVALGAEWPVFAGTAKVAAVHQKVTVPSGDYTDCVVVETFRRDPTRVTRTTFARGVGPIAIEMAVEAHGQLMTTMRASLRGTTKPGQDPLAISAP